MKLTRIVIAFSLAASCFLLMGMGAWKQLGSPPNPMSVEGQFDGGSESCPSDTDNTAGIGLEPGPVGLQVFVEAATVATLDGGCWGWPECWYDGGAGTDASGPDAGDGGWKPIDGAVNALTACTLRACVYSPDLFHSAGGWSRAPDLDLTVAAGNNQAFVGLWVTAPTNRIAYVPYGCTNPSNVFIYAKTHTGP